MRNKGQKLLTKAKKIIPGGNQLLSKRSERFLPDLWPVYYNKANGCEIWDLENKRYYDFAGMGVTSCVLGYADIDVNRAINNVLKKGSMATLNAPEEVELSKLLIKLHPWSDMIRYSKSGGEACSIAIRLARAYTKKDLVLFCGYHGWHDWYLSANIGSNKNLDDQLLPGLQSIGVPKKLKNTNIPFNYNDFNGFNKLIKKYKNKVSCIIMEPKRNLNPENKFLEHIRKIATKNKIVLIFDEITSGFHENLGGIHLKLKIKPDMAVFGKALANGTPISAILGKANIMKFAQESFISSTMWTDRIGFAASLASLKKMKKFNIQKKLVSRGIYIKKNLKKIAIKNNLKIEIFGLNSMPSFKFAYKDSEEMITFFTQEMLKKGFLASSSFAITFAHTDMIIKKYLNSCDKVFNQLSKIKTLKMKIPLESKKRDLNFKRLN